jgi:hypothetical protein
MNVRDRPERDRPERDQPERDRPERDQPEQDQPEQDQPERDRPERDRPERDRPEQDQPEQDRPEQDRPEQDQPEQDQPEQDRAWAANSAMELRTTLQHDYAARATRTKATIAPMGRFQQLVSEEYASLDVLIRQVRPGWRLDRPQAVRPAAPRQWAWRQEVGLPGTATRLAAGSTAVR